MIICIAFYQHHHQLTSHTYIDSPLGDSVRTAVQELDIKSSSNTRKVNFANFNNNVDLNTYIPTFTPRNHRGDSPELDQLNHAIDQVRYV